MECCLLPFNLLAVRVPPCGMKANSTKSMEQTEWLTFVMILSTGQDMICTRNSIVAHAQDFVVHGELLLSFLNALAQCTRSLHATPIGVFSQCVFVQQFVTPYNNNSVDPL
jgi:hypothetical protein